MYESDKWMIFIGFNPRKALPIITLSSELGVSILGILEQIDCGYEYQFSMKSQSTVLCVVIVKAHCVWFVSWIQHGEKSVLEINAIDGN